MRSSPAPRRKPREGGWAAVAGASVAGVANTVCWPCRKRPPLVLSKDRCANTNQLSIVWQSFAREELLLYPRPRTRWAISVAAAYGTAFYIVRELRQPIRPRTLQILVADWAVPLGSVARAEEGTAQAAQKRGHPIRPWRARRRERLLRNVQESGRKSQKANTERPELQSGSAW